MELNQLLYLLMTSLLRQLPQFIVLIVGIVMCFSNRAKAPKASKMALAGLIILFMTDLLGTAIFLFQVYMPLWLNTSMQTVGYVNFAVGFVLSIIAAGGLGLIIYAVWTERNRL